MTTKPPTPTQTARTAARTAYRAVWSDLEPWQQRALTFAAQLQIELETIKPSDHAERRRTINEITRIEAATFAKRVSPAASDAGRALVAQRKDRSGYDAALRVLEGGA